MMFLSNGASIPYVVVLLAGALLLYVFYVIVYNLYLHPLRKFPGPKLWACSEIALQTAVIKGTAHLDITELFNKYGPVVRVAPNEVLFNSAEANRDINWTHHASKSLNGKKETCPKDERFYNKFGLSDDHMVSTVDPNVHARQRRMLSSAFSERSVREQEPMLLEHTSKLIAGIRHQGIKQNKPVDIKQWINFTTFDITGYLVFGESFHCLDDGALHPWVSFMTDSLKAMVLMGVLTRIPGTKFLMPLVVSKKTEAALMQHRKLAAERFDQRLQEGQKTDKAADDLVGLLLKNGMSEKAGGFAAGDDHISRGEVIANSNMLVGAGSETSATLLTGTIFFLLQPSHHRIYTRLRHEIRTTFPTAASITSLTASTLPYLHATIQETLRRYTPAVSSLPRRTPPEGATIADHYVPGNTYLGFPHYAAYHSTCNFTRPEDWVPERWLPAGERPVEFENDRRDVLQPFSLGTYGCLGQPLAWAEIRLILCHLLWHFDMELVEGQDRWMKDQKVWLVWEKPPLHVRVRERVA